MAMKVFIVEHQLPVQQQIAEAVAAAEGLAVVRTERERGAALRWLQEHPGDWDIAVVDFLLEEDFGQEFLHACRAANANGRVVAFSDAPAATVLLRWLEEGAETVIGRRRLGDLQGCLQRLSHEAAAEIG
jgi:two-component system, OmpR family, response regulator